MIIIDGHSSEMKVGSFANLEEILIQIMEKEEMDNRIVTDVLVNDETFSELYPHQAEDIEASEIQKVEVRSVSVAEMAADITGELYKVITLMTVGGKRVAQELRQAEVANALEVLQDVLEVTRHFIATVGLLRSEFSINRENEITGLSEKLDSLLNEMTDVLEQEDWMLMADLTEYEFLPVCESWNSVLGNLAEDIAQFKAA